MNKPFLWICSNVVRLGIKEAYHRGNQRSYKKANLYNTDHNISGAGKRKIGYFEDQQITIIFHLRSALVAMENKLAIYFFLALNNWTVSKL